MKLHRLFLLFAVLVLLIATGARISSLGVQSLWYDEGNSWAQSLRTFNEINANAARDIHPPGYYWLLAMARVLFGESEFALRLPSALAGIVTVALTIVIGRRLFVAPTDRFRFLPLSLRESRSVGQGQRIAGYGAALLAGAFVALNSFSIYYAQEARMYALLACAAAAIMWTLIRVIDQPTPRRAIALGMITAIGLWTHYAFPLVMIAGGVIVLIALVIETQNRARLLLAFILANLLAIILFAPWLPTALQHVTSWPNTGAPIDLVEALNVLARWLTLGIAPNAVSLGIPLLLLIVGLTWRGSTRADHSHGQRWIGLALPVVWAIVPPALFLVFGLFREANLKFLLPSQIAFALWMVRGVWMLSAFGERAREAFGVRRALLIGVPPIAAIAAAAWVLITLADGARLLQTDPAYGRDDYRAIAVEIATQTRAGDVIVLNAPNQAEVFGYYYRGETPVLGLPAGLGGNDASTREALARILGQYERAFVLFYGEGERDPNRIVETTLDGEAYPIDDRWFGDVRLARYLMPAPMPTTFTLNIPFTLPDGGAIDLARAAWNRDTLAPGDALLIDLAWRADRVVPARYKVSVQLLDANGALVAQRDSEPGGGLLPTTLWTPDTLVTDRHALLTPPDLPLGTYTLIVGLYALDAPAARLPITDADHLILTTIEVR